LAAARQSSDILSGFRVLGLLFHPSSYLGFFAFLVLTGCGIPIPEEVAIVLAGVLSAEGNLRWEFALAACLLGAIVGDCVMYAIGYHWGHNLLIAHPRFAKLLHFEREERFEQAVERHAFKVLLFSRFLVGVRGPVYVAAGVVRMPFRRFLLYDLVCATIVVGFFFGLSYAYGNEVANWIHKAEWTATILVLLVFLSAGGYVYFRHRQRVYRAIFGVEPSSDS
jgi:membrane protein DedA with SNARE-associated domain